LEVEGEIVPRKACEEKIHVSEVGEMKKGDGAHLQELDGNPILVGQRAGVAA
jgi:hypothetical protein